MNITVYPDINVECWGIDRYHVVSHPGSHFEFWGYNGSELVKVLLYNPGDMVRFLDRKDYITREGRLTRVTRRLGWIFDTQEERMRRIELCNLAWWSFEAQH